MVKQAERAGFHAVAARIARCVMPMQSEMSASALKSSKAVRRDSPGLAWCGQAQRASRRGPPLRRRARMEAKRIALVDPQAAHSSRIAKPPRVSILDYSGRGRAPGG